MYDIIGYGLFAVLLLCTFHIRKHRANMSEFFVFTTLVSVVGSLAWFCYSAAHADIYRDNPAIFGPPIGLGILTVQVLCVRIRQISSYLSGTHNMPKWFLTFIRVKLVGYYLAVYITTVGTFFVFTLFLKETILG